MFNSSNTVLAHKKTTDLVTDDNKGEGFNSGFFYTSK